MKPYTKPGYQVALRPIQVDDVDAILQWINDPDVTRNFADLSKQITREQELGFLERMRISTPAPSMTWSATGVCEPTPSLPTSQKSGRGREDAVESRQ